MAEFRNIDGDPAEANVMVRTDRLVLRLLRLEDAPSLAEVAAVEWVRGYAFAAGDRRLSPWAVVAEDRVIGFCGFFLHPDKGTTIGYAIVPAYRGRGYATEAAAAVYEWARTNGIDAYSSVRPPNPASVRVLSKIGLTLQDRYVDADGERWVFR